MVFSVILRCSISGYTRYKVEMLCNLIIQLLCTYLMIFFCIAESFCKILTLIKLQGLLANSESVSVFKPLMHFEKIIQ